MTQDPEETDFSDIETERLILRAPVPEDAHVINRELGKWDTARMLASAPHPFPAQSPEEWWAERKDRMFPKTGIWRFLSLKQDPDRTCLGNFAIMPGDTGVWSVGYWVAEDAQGKGYITEALVAGLAHVRRIWDPEMIHAGAYTDNPASRRVLEKVGFTMTKITPEWSEARQCDTPHWNFQLVR